MANIFHLFEYMSILLCTLNLINLFQKADRSHFFTLHVERSVVQTLFATTFQDLSKNVNYLFFAKDCSCAYIHSLGKEIKNLYV